MRSSRVPLWGGIVLLLGLLAVAASFLSESGGGEEPGPGAVRAVGRGPGEAASAAPAVQRARQERAPPVEEEGGQPAADARPTPVGVAAGPEHPLRAHITAANLHDYLHWDEGTAVSQAVSQLAGGSGNALQLLEYWAEVLRSGWIVPGTMERFPRNRQQERVVFMLLYPCSTTTSGVALLEGVALRNVPRRTLDAVSLSGRVPLEWLRQRQGVTEVDLAVELTRVATEPAELVGELSVRGFGSEGSRPMQGGLGTPLDFRLTPTGGEVRAGAGGPAPVASATAASAGTILELLEALLQAQSEKEK